MSYGNYYVKAQKETQRTELTIKLGISHHNQLSSTDHEALQMALGVRK